ncbi:MAG: LysR family transcriptional regulator [Pseudomonadota bacterium]
MMIPWDDLRFVLAIAETGSLSAAGRRLGVSHATVFRRLGGIEDRLGVALFERSRTGYAPTLAGEEVADAARVVEREVLDVERRVVGRDLRPSGTVRVATLDSFLVGFLSPIFRAFQDEQRDIALEVSLSNHLFSLSRREADVAIRPSYEQAESLVGRKAGTIAYAVYGERERVADAGGSIDIHDAQWVGPDEAMYYPDLVAWMTAQGLDDRCRFRVDSVVAMQAAVADGYGLAVLPCYLGDPDLRLSRVGRTIPGMAVDLLLLTHPDLRKTARVRVLLDYLAAALKKKQRLLLGTASR